MSLRRSIAARLGRRYSAGPELSDALAVGRLMAERGAAATVCFWDTGDEAPREVANAYVAAADAVRDLDCRVSTKLPALGFDGGLLDEVATAAERAAAPLHIDSLGPDVADRTFSLAG